MEVRNTRSSILAILLGCVLFASAQAALAVRISAALPVGSSSQFIIQPGESTTFAVDFTNLDATAGMGSAWSYQNLAGLGESWVIEPIDPVICGFPTRGEGLRLEFPVELQASETRRCVYTMKRSATTYRDGHLQICLGHQSSPGTSCNEPGVLVFGTLPDVGVTLVSLGAATPDSTASLFRINASNAAAVPTEEIALYTHCRNIGDADPMTNLPFRIETGFPGACPAASIERCSFEPPLEDYGWRVSLPSIPAGGNISCLVRMQLGNPLGEPVSDRLSTWPVYPFFPGHRIPLIHAGASPGAGLGYDMNPSNDVAPFQLGQTALPTVTVPIGGWLPWSALALLLVSAGWNLQRQRRTAVSKNQAAN